jgi:hypothetical protein
MTARETGELPILARYRCIYCWRQISKWSKPRGLCRWCRENPTEHIGGNVEKRKKLDRRREANHGRWKPSDLSYAGVHSWIRRELGPATHCSNDDTHESKRYEWANISGDYKRDINDYRPLCKSCHSKYDMSDNYKESMRKNWQKYANTLRKPVYQFTFDGLYIARYESVSEAARKNGLRTNNISANLLVVDHMRFDGCSLCW